MVIFSDLIMSQVEKKAGLLRRTSSSKKPLKEKVVLMYDEIFAVSIIESQTMSMLRVLRNALCSSANNVISA